MYYNDMLNGYIIVLYRHLQYGYFQLRNHCIIRKGSIPLLNCMFSDYIDHLGAICSCGLTRPLFPLGRSLGGVRVQLRVHCAADCAPELDRHGGPVQAAPAAGARAGPDAAVPGAGAALAGAVHAQVGGDGADRAGVRHAAPAGARAGGRLHGHQHPGARPALDSSTPPSLACTPAHPWRATAAVLK